MGVSARLRLNNCALTIMLGKNFKQGFGIFVGKVAVNHNPQGHTVGQNDIAFLRPCAQGVQIFAGGLHKNHIGRGHRNG